MMLSHRGVCPAIGHAASARCPVPHVPVRFPSRSVVIANAEASESRRKKKEIPEEPLDFLEVAVPRDQRPANELQQLKDGMLYSWGTLPINDFSVRVFATYAIGFAILGGPISYQTFSPTDQPIEWFLAGTTGTMLVVALVVTRIFLGWSYVSERLLSAAIPYEETGWYDGETFVKPPEILTRDRLLGMYEAKPVLRKLKGTLVGTGVTLAVSAILLTGLVKSGADEDGFYGRGASIRPRMVTNSGPIFSREVTDLSQLRTDDALAAKEAAAAGGIPGYCRDRLLKAYAGGQYCPPV
eukprot:gene22899-30075_t